MTLKTGVKRKIEKVIYNANNIYAEDNLNKLLFTFIVERNEEEID